MALYKCDVCGKVIRADTRPEGWETKWKEQPQYGKFTYSTVWECGEHQTDREVSVIELDLFG